MKALFTSLSIVIINGLTAQPTSLIYNFKTDYYWDSTLYKSAMSFYYEVKGNEIIQKNYPVKIYRNSQILQDSPLVKKDFFFIDRSQYDPYSYEKHGDSIFIKFYNYELKKKVLHLEYIISFEDSVNFMLDKWSIYNKQSGNGISVEGQSNYLGKRNLLFKNNSITCYCFKEIHKHIADDVRNYEIKEIYIDSNSLIPVQITRWIYNMDDIYTNYYSVTKIQSITRKVPDFKMQRDLLLYQNENLIWSEKQKNIFLNRFGNNPVHQKYLHCLLKLIDGNISFYEHEENPHFKLLCIRSECNKLIEQ